MQGDVVSGYGDVDDDVNDAYEGEVPLPEEGDDGDVVGVREDGGREADVDGGAGPDGGEGLRRSPARAGGEVVRGGDHPEEQDGQQGAQGHRAALGDVEPSALRQSSVHLRSLRHLARSKSLNPWRRPQVR